MALISGSFANIPHHIAQAMQSAQAPYPEDLEAIDRQNLQEVQEHYMNTAYPKFEPEIIHTFEKDYFLPALKMLYSYEGKFFSPGFDTEWPDMELHAQCIPRWQSNQDEPYHEAPNEVCDCGIYGSVNLEEVYEYMHLEKRVSRPPIIKMTDANVYSFPVATYVSIQEYILKNVLCIVEPYPDAKVIMCRKGWKASHAFISEFVGETISVQDASQLLSIAWHRDINLWRILGNEDWENR